MENSDFLDAIKDEDGGVDMEVFKTQLISLFDGYMKGGYIEDKEKIAKLARIRARLIIEMKDL